jgi:hypothetical protein
LAGLFLYIDVFSAGPEPATQVLTIDIIYRD